MTGSPVVLVRGTGDVGSAVTHRLYMLGASVILHDRPAPHHMRRGMAFADALFDGVAVLDGVPSRRALTIDDVRRQLDANDDVPVSDGPLDELLAGLRPAAVVDARMRKRATSEDQRELAPTVIGLGPGFVAAGNCTLAIETAWGPDLGTVVDEGSTSALAGEPRLLGDVGRERFIYAPHDGLWRTARRIGERVSAGQVVGHLGEDPVFAPLTGALKGLSHDTAAIVGGQKIIEIDPRPEAEVFGLGKRPGEIACGVARALALEVNRASAFLGFESVMERTLLCIPMSVRMKLDLCGLKVSLEQWRGLPIGVRETLLFARCDATLGAHRVRRYLERMGDANGIGKLRAVRTDVASWRDSRQVPLQVQSTLEVLQLPSIETPTWASLSDLQRLALIKLTREGHTGKLRPALQEFNLLPASTRGRPC